MSTFALLALLACTPGSDTGANTDTDADTDTVDTDGACAAALEVVLPDATPLALTCTSATAEAGFEYTADATSEVRSLGVRLAAGASEAAGCALAFDLTGICGPGWYAFGDDASGAAASGTVATLDCSGTPDGAGALYALTGGSISLSAVTGASDAPGAPSLLHVVGTIAARSEEGLLVSGSFTIDRTVLPEAVGAGVCLVEATEPGHDDLDHDGWDGATGTGEDCDDADATVYPGAYDRPDDGVDADCDGVDRTFDGVLVDAGVTTTTELTYTADAGEVGLDVALVLDTTCSMGGDAVGALDVATVAAMTTGAGDARWSLATFDDYTSAASRPFTLVAQSTDDLSAVQAAIDATSTHSGARGSEAGMEALYQALTGVGYDQDCDGAFDASTDVPPFRADATDPFGGSAAERYDAAVSGTGAGGGVGVRTYARPVVVLITDRGLRDPAGSGLPGGCPGDAAEADVAAAAVAADAWIVGVLVSGDEARDQLDALALATGQRVDADGDGVADDTAIWTIAPDLNTQIAAALDAVAATSPLTGGAYAEVRVEVGDDPYDVVEGVLPASFTDVTPGQTLAFELALRGVVTDVALRATITLLVYGDGTLLYTIPVDVEIAPG